MNGAFLCGSEFLNLIIFEFQAQWSSESLSSLGIDRLQSEWDVVYCNLMYKRRYTFFHELHAPFDFGHRNPSVVLILVSIGYSSSDKQLQWLNSWSKSSSHSCSVISQTMALRTSGKFGVCYLYISLKLCYLDRVQTRVQTWSKQDTLHYWQWRGLRSARTLCGGTS